MFPWAPAASVAFVLSQPLPEKMVHLAERRNRLGDLTFKREFFISNGLVVLFSQNPEVPGSQQSEQPGSFLQGCIM